MKLSENLFNEHFEEIKKNFFLLFRYDTRQACMKLSEN